MSLDRIAAWIQASGLKEYRLVYRDEVIDEYKTDKDLTEDDANDVVAEFDAAAAAHCEGDGRAGVHIYKVTGLSDDDVLTCPLKIRKSPENSVQFGKLVAELHKILVKRDRSEYTSLRETVRELAKEAKENRRERREFFKLLENARSKELERKIAWEEHESREKMQERIVNAGVPALLAIANTIVGGNMLPAPDIRATSLTEIARSFEPEQIDQLGKIIEDEDFGEKLAQAVDGQTDVDYFMTLFRSLNMQQAQGLFGVLNPGQQANLQALLKMGVHNAN